MPTVLPVASSHLPGDHGAYDDADHENDADYDADNDDDADNDSDDGRDDGEAPAPNYI